MFANNFHNIVLYMLLKYFHIFMLRVIIFSTIIFSDMKDINLSSNIFTNTLFLILQTANKLQQTRYIDNLF